MNGMVMSWEDFKEQLLKDLDKIQTFASEDYVPRSAIRLVVYRMKRYIENTEVI